MRICVYPSLLLAAFCCLPCRAQNVLHLSDMSGELGDTVVLELSVENVDTVTGLQCDIAIDSNLAYVDRSAHLTGRAGNSHSVSVNIVPDGALRVLIFSLGQEGFSGNQGAICSLQCVITTGPGDYLIALKKVILSSLNAENIATDSTGGLLAVEGEVGNYHAGPPGRDVHSRMTVPALVTRGQDIRIDMRGAGGNLTLRIFDAFGNRVGGKRFAAWDSPVRIGTDGLGPGVYFLDVENVFSPVKCIVR